MGCADPAHLNREDIASRDFTVGVSDVDVAAANENPEEAWSLGWDILITPTGRCQNGISIRALVVKFNVFTCVFVYDLDVRIIGKRNGIRMRTVIGRPKDVRPSILAVAGGLDIRLPSCHCPRCQFNIVNRIFGWGTVRHIYAF